MTQTTGGVLAGRSISCEGWKLLGLAILTESFRWAAFGALGATTMPRHTQRITEAQRFLFHGTSLEVMADLFGIGMTGEEVRGAFESWIRQRTTPYHP